jgi:hypothetical protein
MHMSKCDGYMYHAASAISMGALVQHEQNAFHHTALCQARSCHHLDAEIIYMYKQVCVQPTDVYVGCT